MMIGNSSLAQTEPVPTFNSSLDPTGSTTERDHKVPVNMIMLITVFTDGKVTKNSCLLVVLFIVSLELHLTCLLTRSGISKPKRIPKGNGFCQVMPVSSYNYFNCRKCMRPATRGLVISFAIWARRQHESDADKR